MVCRPREDGRNRPTYPQDFRCIESRENKARKQPALLQPSTIGELKARGKTIQPEAAKLARLLFGLARRGLDFDVHARRQAQLVESLNGFGGRLNNVDQALVRPNLELLARFLVDMRAREDRITLNPRGKGDRSMHLGMGSLDRVDDLLGALVQNRMVVRFHSDANNFLGNTRHETATPD